MQDLTKTYLLMKFRLCTLVNNLCWSEEMEWSFTTFASARRFLHQLKEKHGKENVKAELFRVEKLEGWEEPGKDNNGS